MSRRWGSKNLTYLSGALLLAWTVGMTVLIAHQPDRGAASPAELTSTFVSALHDDDRGEIKRLVYGDVDPDVIDRLMRDARCGPEADSGEAVIEVRRADGSVCGKLKIAEHKGRWYIDAWADPLGRM